MPSLISTALSFNAGILAGQLFLYVPWSAIAAMLFLAVMMLHSFRRAARPMAKLLLSFAVASGGAVALVIAATYLPPDHYAQIGRLDGSPRTVRGRVVSPFDRGPQRTVFLLDLAALDGETASGRVRTSVRDDAVRIGYGDVIEMTGRFSPPRGSRNPGGFDHPLHLARQGIHGIMNVRHAQELRVIDQGGGPIRMVQDLRERIRQAFLRSTTGEGSAVLQAMVLGEEAGLTDGLRDRFMAAGVTHILSISGSHLGLVALLCFWTCRQVLFLLPERLYHRLTLQLDPRKLAAALTIVPVTFYAFLAGGQVATVRALIMILAGLAAVLLDRDGDLLSALALAALITLLPAPRALFDLSFQLSYLSVISIVFVVTTWNQLGLHRTAGPRKWLLRCLLLLVISLATALATGPLVAHHFRQVSLAGIVANMVAVPFAGAIVVPLGLISGIVSLFIGDLPLAALNQVAADGFVSLVSFFAALPLAAFRVPAPGPLQIVCAAGLLVAGALWCKDRLLARYQLLSFPSRPPRCFGALAAVSIAVFLITAAVGLFQRPENVVTFLDVGQGDCVLVQTAGGKSILIDGGGTRDNRFDVGSRIVMPYLLDRGIDTIDLAVLSHPHPDHMNGFASVLRTLPVRELWWSGHDEELEGFSALRQIAADRHTTVRAVSSGHRAEIGDTVLEVLHPATAAQRSGRRPYAAENDRSLVVRLRLGGTMFLFTGDIHRDGEQALLRQAGTLRSGVIKVPHHGSRSSSTDDFVRALHPSLAVISVGSGNPYRHPAEEVIERYQTSGANVSRTDRDGAVIVRTSEGTPHAVHWSGLLLRTADPAHITTWWKTERSNWKRLWFRTTAI